MTENNVTQAILTKLDLVYQKTALGDLVSAFHIIEEVGSLINMDESDAERNDNNEIEKEFFLELVHLYASLRRKLLKEMAKSL